MGCLNSKQENGKDKSDEGKNPPGGNVQFSALPTGNADACGMSQRQVFSLKQSWKGIKRRMEDTGVEMFVRLFSANRNLQQMFPSFKNITSDDELRSSELLENHAVIVMTALDEAISQIDNYEPFQQHLYKIAAVHVGFPGFKPDTFMSMKEPFLEAVRVTLGDRYTDNMQNIYGLAITFVLQTLTDGVNEALKKDGDVNINGTANKIKHD